MQPFITAQHQGRHGWPRVLGVLALVILPTVAVSAAAQILVLGPLMGALESDTLKGLAVSVYVAGLFAVAAGLLCVGVRKVHGRSLATLVSGQRRFSWRDLAFGFGLYGALLVAAATVADATSVVEAARAAGPAQLAVLAVPLALAFVVQGGTEELLLRGYFPQVLFRWFGSAKLAYAVPGVLFAVLHIGYGLGGFLHAALFALFATVVVVRRGSLAEVMGLHGANNFVVVWLLSDIGEASRNTGWAVDGAELVATIAVFGAYLAVSEWRARAGHSGKVAAAAPVETAPLETA